MEVRKGGIWSERRDTLWEVRTGGIWKEHRDTLLEVRTGGLWGDRRDTLWEVRKGGLQSERPRASPADPHGEPATQFTGAFPSRLPACL